MQNVAVGFDLGTTLSVASVVDRSGRPRSLEGPTGSPLIPSAIYFGDQVVIGEAALERGLGDPDGLAEGFKRDVGRAHYGRQIRHCQVPPEVLTAFMLDHLAQLVRQETGEFLNAVLTVPAFFDEKKRTATQHAAKLAGVEVLDIVNEPTAAAIAAGHEAMLQSGRESSKPQRILVYDLGGGTFDVTLLEFSDRTFRAIATDGDIFLGGRDFDERITQLVADEFRQRHGVDPRTNVADAQRLWRLAQEAKHQLTEHDSHSISFQHAGLLTGFELPREAFEEAIEPLIELSLTTTSEVMREANLSWDELDEFLLVGGSSRIPLVARKAAELWGRTPRLVDSPDVLISQGAALYAASKLDAQFLDAAARFEVVNVNAHSLGIQGIDVATQQKVNKILIPRNSPLPATNSRTFVTHRDGQKNVKVRLLEGESENPEYCTVLGDCVVRIDPPMPQGSPVRVNCNYASNGTISVTAKLGKNNASAYVEIRRDGYSALESLAVWRSRLTTGDHGRITGNPRLTDAAPVIESAAKVNSSSDVATILEQLDTIYGYVGKLAASETPPVSAIQSHQLIGRLVTETETLSQLVASLDRQHRQATQFQTRMEMAGQLAQAKMAWEQSMRLLEHCHVVLGRECVFENVVPVKAARFVDESERLQKLLEQVAG